MEKETYVINFEPETVVEEYAMEESKPLMR